MDISELDYQLQDDKIALFPTDKRDNSKLLLYTESCEIIDSYFTEIEHLISPNDLLILNNTKVIPARIKAEIDSGATIEIFCLSPHEKENYNNNTNDSLAHNGNTENNDKTQWNCLIGGKRKWKQNTIYICKQNIKLSLELIDSEDNLVEFAWNYINPKQNQPLLSFYQVLNIFGSVPLPPYIKRELTPNDYLRYQTVFAKEKGSVAAPTASLHFTDNILSNLASKGTAISYLTLHVGAGTFLPITTKNVLDHKMHGEYFEISKETVSQILNCSGKIISVGTTATRTLEGLTFIAEQIKNASTNRNANSFSIPQKNPHSTLSRKEICNTILLYMERNNLESIHGISNIMITEDHQVKMVDSLITNFHQPKSTLLLLISSFVGNQWREIYTHALKNNYRFLSYGDSSMLSLIKKKKLD